MKPSYFLVKSEPFKYAFATLCEQGRTMWDGVRNFEARNNLRSMRVGDLLLFYHSNEGKAVVGVATVITNVMGPPFPVYCAGAQLVQFYPLGLLNPGLGLFHAVFSMSGNVSITVTADRDQMPDPEFYGECIAASYEELRDALLGAPAAQPRKRRARRVA